MRVASRVRDAMRHAVSDRVRACGSGREADARGAGAGGRPAAVFEDYDFERSTSMCAQCVVCVSVCASPARPSVRVG